MNNFFNNKSVVITGAASGIGRATAFRIAKHNAKLALIDVNFQGLQTLKKELDEKNVESLIFEVDVTDLEAMKDAAKKTAEQFGRIDVWVNNAAVAIYGEITRVPVDDVKKLMDINFFGQLNGIHAAFPYVSLPESLGRIIGIGSVLAEITAPLIGTYTASKHAVQGLYKSLHEELKHNKSKVKVATILPSAINTPLFKNTKTYIGVEPQVFPPYYSPYHVADLILKRAKKPKLSTVAGNAGSFSIFAFRMSPGLYHWLQGRLGYWWQHTDKPKKPTDENNLDHPIQEDGRIYGDHHLYIPAVVARMLYPRYLIMGLGSFLLYKKIIRPYTVKNLLT